MVHSFDSFEKIRNPKCAQIAYKFTVITSYPNEISDEIMYILKHDITKVTAQGAYTNSYGA